MPIVSLNGSPLEDQQRAVTVGKIRLGHQVVRNNKSFPAKLDAFRLTSPAEHQIRAAADVYGGKPTRIQEGRLAGQWEVYTPRDTLPVVVPNTNSVTQWMEMWSAAGCQRRCDGDTIRMRGQEHPCLCPKDQQAREAMAARGSACKPVTRVSLVLPDLPGMAVWVVESHGINAALEMAQVALSLGLAAERGSFLPAQIRMDHRETRIPSRNPDEPPKVSKFAVPVLEIIATMRELVEGGTASGQLRLPPAPSDMKALVSGPSGRPAPAEPVRPSAAPWVGQPGPDDEPIDAEIVQEAEQQPVAWPAPATPGGGLRTAAVGIAADAARATTVEDVNRLLADAQAQGCLADLVQDPDQSDGPLVTLRQVLTGKARAIASRGPQ